jgi:hypothetical protein
MGLILSEPIKKVVEVLKILSKMSVEDAKIASIAVFSGPSARLAATRQPAPAPISSSV